MTSPKSCKLHDCNDQKILEEMYELKIEKWIEIGDHNTIQIANSLKIGIEELRGIDGNCEGKLQKMKYMVEISIKEMIRLQHDWKFADFINKNKLDSTFESNFTTGLKRDSKHQFKSQSHCNEIFDT